MLSAGLAASCGRAGTPAANSDRTKIQGGCLIAPALLGLTHHLTATARATAHHVAMHPGTSTFDLGNDGFAVGADVLAILAQQRPLAVELAHLRTREMRSRKRLRRTASGGVRIAGTV